MRIIDILIQVQTIDRELDGIRPLLEQTQREIGDRSALAPVQRELDRITAELHQIEGEQRDLELNAETKRTKIASDEQRLYGGKVGNPKELDSLTQEIAQEKRQVAPIEDRLLELLENDEALQTALTDAKQRLVQATTDWEGRQSRSQQKAAELLQTISALESNRERLAGQVDAPTRASYENLRRTKGGIALGNITQRLCQACRVGITPAIEQRARIGTDLVPCPSCGRFLFIPLK